MSKLKKRHWRTRDGQDMKMSDMTDRHLVHTIRFLERTTRVHTAKEAYALLMAGPPSGEMAEHEYYNMLDMALRGAPPYADFMVPKYEELLEEAESRQFLGGWYHWYENPLQAFHDPSDPRWKED